MGKIDARKRNVEIKDRYDDAHGELLQYLSNILNDRSIPEENKQNVRKQYDEIMRIMTITKKHQIVIATS